jgi:hypothetical protein
MTEAPAHFVATDDDAYLPTRFAKSRWGEDHLGGPAVVGLAAATLEAEYGLDEFMPARLTVDLFKAARGVPTTCKTGLVRAGRRVRNAECEVVQDGVTVARATLVQYRRAEAPRGEEWLAASSFVPPPNPDEACAIYVGDDAVGWTATIADHRNAARKRTYSRPIDVVEGRPATAFARAAMAAEGTSLVTHLGTQGVGYINGDLTVALARLPVGGWIGVQTDTHLVADGISVGTATLFDARGAFGTGTVTAVSNPGAQIDFADDAFPSATG